MSKTFLDYFPKQIKLLIHSNNEVYMTNEQIIRSFIFGRSSDTNKRKPLSIRDGKLYSYNLVIGEYIHTPDEGFSGLLIHDHTATGQGFVSMTTSQHVSLLKRLTEWHPRQIK